MRCLGVLLISIVLTTCRRVRWRLGLFVGGIGGLLHGIVEAFGVQTGVVERITASAVRQRQFGGYANVLLVDGGGSPPRGVRHRGARDHEISAHAVDVERRTQRRNAP